MVAYDGVDWNILENCAQRFKCFLYGYYVLSNIRFPGAVVDHVTSVIDVVDFLKNFIINALI